MAGGLLPSARFLRKFVACVVVCLFTINQTAFALDFETLFNATVQADNSNTLSPSSSLKPIVDVKKVGDKYVVVQSDDDKPDFDDEDFIGTVGILQLNRIMSIVLEKGLLVNGILDERSLGHLIDIYFRENLRPNSGDYQRLKRIYNWDRIFVEDKKICIPFENIEIDRQQLLVYYMKDGLPVLGQLLNDASTIDQINVDEAREGYDRYYMPIFREGEEYSSEGEGIAKMHVGGMENEGAINSLAHSIAQEEGMPSLENVERLLKIIYRYYRVNSIRAPDAPGRIDGYFVDIRKGLRHPAQFDTENEAIILDIDLFKVGEDDLVPFLTFIAGHEGRHLDMDEDDVIEVDIERFSKWTQKHQDAVINALLSLGADRHYVYTLIVEAAEHYRHQAQYPGYSISMKRTLYKRSLALCRKALAEELPVDIYINASNCRGYAAMEMGRLAFRELEEGLKGSWDKGDITRSREEIEEWIFSYAVPNCRSIFYRARNSNGNNTKGVPRACAGAAFSYELLDDLEKVLEKTYTPQELYESKRKRIKYITSALSFGVSGVRIDQNNQHAVSALGDAISSLEEVLKDAVPANSIASAKRDVSIMKTVMKHLHAAESLPGIDNKRRGMVKRAFDRATHLYDKAKTIVSAVEEVPNIFLEIVTERGFTRDVSSREDFDLLLEMTIEDRYQEIAPIVMEHVVSLREKYDHLDLAILSVLAKADPPKVWEIKSLSRYVRQASRGECTREELLTRVNSGRYVWLGIDPVVVEAPVDTNVTRRGKQLSPRVASDHVDIYTKRIEEEGKRIEALIPWLDTRDAENIQNAFNRLETKLKEFSDKTAEVSSSRRADRAGQIELHKLWEGERSSPGCKRLYDNLARKVKLRYDSIPISAIRSLRGRVNRSLVMINKIKEMRTSSEVESILEQIREMIAAIDILESRDHNRYISKELYDNLMGESEDLGEGNGISTISGIVELEEDVSRTYERFSKWENLKEHLKEVEKSLKATQLLRRDRLIILSEADSLNERLDEQYDMGPQEEIGSKGVAEGVARVVEMKDILLSRLDLPKRIESNVKKDIAEYFKRLDDVESFVRAEENLEHFAEIKEALGKWQDDILNELSSLNYKEEFEEFEERWPIELSVMDGAVQQAEHLKMDGMFRSIWPALVTAAAFLYKERLMLAGIEEQYNKRKVFGGGPDEDVWYIISAAEEVLYKAINVNVEEVGSESWLERIKHLYAALRVLAYDKGAVESFWQKSMAERGGVEEYLSPDYMRKGMWTLVDDSVLIAEEEERRKWLEDRGLLGLFSEFSMRDIAGMYGITPNAAFSCIKDSKYYALERMPDLYKALKASFGNELSAINSDLRQMDKGVKQVLQDSTLSLLLGEDSALSRLQFDMGDLSKKEYDERWDRTKRLIRSLGSKYPPEKMRDMSLSLRAVVRQGEEAPKRVEVNINDAVRFAEMFLEEEYLETVIFEMDPLLDSKDTPRSWVWAESVTKENGLVSEGNAVSNIVQLLRYVVANSLYYKDMPGGKDLKVLVKTIYDPSTGKAILIVRDNGPGMSSSELTKIFEDRYTTKEGLETIKIMGSEELQGGGLGLSFVKAIGGNSLAEIRTSSTLGQGTIFSFTFEPSLEQEKGKKSTSASGRPGITHEEFNSALRKMLAEGRGSTILTIGTDEISPNNSDARKSRYYYLANAIKANLPTLKEIPLVPFGEFSPIGYMPLDLTRVLMGKDVTGFKSVPKEVEVVLVNTPLENKGALFSDSSGILQVAHAGKGASGDEQRLIVYLDKFFVDKNIRNLKVITQLVSEEIAEEVARRNGYDPRRVHNHLIKSGQLEELYDTYRIFYKDIIGDSPNFYYEIKGPSDGNIASGVPEEEEEEFEIYSGLSLELSDVVLEQKEYPDVSSKVTTIYPVVHFSVNGQKFKVGKGYYIELTFADGSKGYWAGQHNLSYSFFFEHFKERTADIIASGGIEWKYMDAHLDEDGNTYTEGYDPSEVDWQDEIEFGKEDLQIFNYLSAVKDRGLALELYKAHSLFPDRGKTEIGLSGMSVLDPGGVADIDIDIVVGEIEDLNQWIAREHFQQMKPYLVHISATSEVSFFINSTELSRDYLGVPLHINPNLAIEFNGEIIRKVAEVKAGQASSPGEIDPAVERALKATEDLLDALFRRAIVKRSQRDKNLMVAIDTSWLEGLGRGQRALTQRLVNEVTLRLEAECKEAGLDNIIIVEGRGDELKRKIKDEVERTGCLLKDVVVLAGKDSVLDGGFEELISTPEEERAFIAMVDASDIMDRDHLEINEDNYIFLIEMLTLAVKMGFGETDGRGDPFIDVMNYSDDIPKLFYFFPRAEAFEIERLKDIYDSQAKKLNTAA